jgi:hypothetical protein
LHDDDLRALAADLAERVPDRNARLVELEVERANLLPHLRALGYTGLYGTSASRGVYDLPYYTSVRYLFARGTKTHLPASFVDCCILLREPERAEVADVAEILKTGGLAVFRGEEGQSEGDRRLGLERVGSIKGGFEVLRKSIGRERMRASVSVLNYSDTSGGITEYSNLVAGRLKAAGTSSEVVSSAGEVTGDNVIMEYANGLKRGADLMRDVGVLIARGKRVVVDIHDTLERFAVKERRNLQVQVNLAYRANEAAERDQVSRYVLVPHLSYSNLPAQSRRNGGCTVIGSFGFAAKYKRYPLIVRLARKLDVDLKLMVSVNEEAAPFKTALALEELAKEIGCRIPGPGTYASKGVELEVGFFETAKIAETMSACSHLVFAHTTSGFHHSGVMTMAKRFSRPIVSLDSFQAKQAQVLRTRSFFKGQGLVDATKSFGAGLLHRRLETRTFFGAVAGVMTSKSLDNEFLEQHSADLSRDEDGLDYLEAILGYSE